MRKTQAFFRKKACLFLGRRYRKADCTKNKCRIMQNLHFTLYFSCPIIKYTSVWVFYPLRIGGPAQGPVLRTGKRPDFCSRHGGVWFKNPPAWGEKAAPAAFQNKPQTPWLTFIFPIKIINPSRDKGAGRRRLQPLCTCEACGGPVRVNPER